MKLYEEAQHIVDDAQNIVDRLKNIESKNEKEIPLDAVAQDLAELMYECAKLRREVLDETL